MAAACQCGEANIDGTFFCEQCGTALDALPSVVAVARVCMKCGSPNQPEAMNCQYCQAVLAVLAPNSTETGARPRLVARSSGTVFTCTKDSVLIGRADPSSDVYPDIDLTAHGGDEAGVSRSHAIIRRSRDQYVIEDQDSVNKSYLNKQRLEAYKPVVIRGGDELRLGKFVLHFEID